MRKRIITAMLLAAGYTSASAQQPMPKPVHVPPRQPEVFGPGVLSAGRVYRGTFARDGRTFYFFKKLSERGEDYRIFVARQVKGVWTEPQLLRLGDDINSPGYDNFWFLSPDGRELFFVRDFRTFYRMPLRAALRTNK